MSLTACSSTQKSKPAAAATPVNKVCPVGGHSTEGTGITASFQGKTVGFCCESCVDEWKKLSDAERSAKLKEAMASR
jgi:hypothetical protein